MAKKKKTKVGNIIQKAKDAANNVVNKIKTSAANVNLAADTSNLRKKATEPVFKARVGEGMTGKAREEALAKLTPNALKTEATLKKIGTTPLTVKQDTKGKLSLQGLDFSNGQTSTNNLKSQQQTLSKASAPSTADATLAAARAPSISMASAPSSSSTSTTTMGIGSTSTANAAVAGIEQANNQRLQEQQTLEKKMLESENGKKSILDQLFKQQQQEPTRQELRREYEDAFKIQEQTAEINSLNQDLDKVMNEVANQEAVARDRLGTNDFINNQIAQIRRNSEPIINQLTSEIKWRSGLLADDKALMNEAISDALADSRSRIETNRWFANEYIGMLDKKYQQAYNEYMKNEERAYDERRDFLEYARDIAWEYAQKGIRMNINPYTITPDELAEKIARNPLPQKSGGSSSSSSIDQAALQAYIADYKSGKITLSNIPDKYRDAVVAGAVVKPQELPNWNLFNAGLKRDFDLVGVDKSDYNEVKNLVENEGYSLEQIRASQPDLFTQDVYDTFIKYVK